MEHPVGTKVILRSDPKVQGVIAGGKDHDGDYRIDWINPSDTPNLVLNYCDDAEFIVTEGPTASPCPVPATMPEKALRRHQASQTSSPRGACGANITLKEEQPVFGATQETVTTVATEAISTESDIVKTEGKTMATISDASSLNQTRRTVTLNLIDPDTSLDVSKSLVGTYGPVVVEDDIQTVINEICMEQDVANAIANHNKKREKETDLTILKNTGNKVGLQPVKLKDLKWEIK